MSPDTRSVYIQVMGQLLYEPIKYKHNLQTAIALICIIYRYEHSPHVRKQAAIFIPIPTNNTELALQ